MYSLIEIKELNENTGAHLFQFSQWMKGSGVAPHEVFSVSKLAIEQQSNKLSVYVISQAGSAVGYLALFLGLESIRISRLNFFTISPSLRGEGQGKDILLSCLRHLMMEVDVTSVACHESLVGFYKACGFDHVGKADNGDELLLFSLFPIDNPEAVIKERVALVGYDGSFKEQYTKLEKLVLGARPDLSCVC
ncbi:GNAT family N-acetyltransferase [Vibrio atlanticus]|uniref:GNAT family N-acetyltransferase n=1 Tax=Vibrio atlanticus TaxID=693153 RepID=UPI003D0DEEE0